MVGQSSRSKRKVGNLLKKWRNGKALKEEYTKARREWKELCEEKENKKRRRGGGIKRNKERESSLGFSN